MRRGPALGALLSLILTTTAAAQERVQLPPPILTLDQEKLFAESRAAERISDEIERLSNELAAENRLIEAELESEELELTEQRAEMEPAAFRKLADAFDAKVQRIRVEQDAKARDLQRRREEEQQDFLRRITPLLATIVQERGALIVLDRRSVFLSADSIDITDEAIRRINAALDANAVEPAPEQDGATVPPPGTVEDGNTPDNPSPDAAPDNGAAPAD